MTEAVVVQMPARMKRDGRGLTRIELRCARQLSTLIRDTGRWPTVLEMRKMTGVKSDAGMQRIVNNLVAHGMLKEAHND